MTTILPIKSSLTAWERWELASFDAHPAPVAAAAVKVEDVTTDTSERDEFVEQLREEVRAAAEAEGRKAGYEAGQVEGHKAGYDSGHAEGYAAGEAEGRAKGEADAEALGKIQAEKLAQAAAALDARIAELGPAVANELLALSLEIARQVIRQTIEHHPEIIVDVIREALAQLPLQQAAIHLHPDDVALVRRLAGEELAHSSHRIREDPKLARGDVVIESGGSHLDATLSNRWARVVASLGSDAPWVATQTTATSDESE